MKPPEREGVRLRLGDLAERIIYRRDHAVSTDLREALADDANTVTEAAEQLMAVEALVEAARRRAIEWSSRAEGMDKHRGGIYRICAEEIAELLAPFTEDTDHE